MFEIGLVSVSFRSLSAEEIVSLCKSNGLPYIEWGSDIHAPCTDTPKLQWIASLQREHGVSCSSYGTYFRLGEHGTEELCGYIEAAKILGTTVLRVWCGSKNYEELTAEEREHMITEGKKAARIAERAGVTLCMECHNKTFTNCSEGALTLMREINSPAFRMYWQPNQYRSIKENLDYAEAIAPYTDVIHAFQWKGKCRYPLSDGIEEWRSYLSRFDGHQKLLLEFMPDDNPDTLASETASLIKILEELK